MTDIEKIESALNQIDRVIELMKDNPYKTYLYQHLSPLHYELNRQLVNLTIVEKPTKITE
nr:hypothetical protein [uncultured Mediterranean phage uvMED]